MRFFYDLIGLGYYKKDINKTPKKIEDYEKLVNKLQKENKVLKRFIKKRNKFTDIYFITALYIPILLLYLLQLGIFKVIGKFIFK